MKARFLLVLAFVLMAPAVFAQRDFANVEIKAVPVAKNSGGTVEGYLKTVATVLEKLPADARIIPGHGKLATVDDLKEFHTMLVETTGFVKKSMAAGKSLEEIKSAGLPEKWKSYGTGFINTGRWIETIHRSATKK